MGGGPAGWGHCLHHIDSDLESTIPQSHILELRGRDASPVLDAPRGRGEAFLSMLLFWNTLAPRLVDGTTSEKAQSIGRSECCSQTKEVRAPPERPPPHSRASLMQEVPHLCPCSLPSHTQSPLSRRNLPRPPQSHCGQVHKR